MRHAPRALSQASSDFLGSWYLAAEVLLRSQ